jgi:hypothetical protein
MTPVSSPRHSTHVARPRSDPSLRQRSKSIDMNLAYGNIPPDLASRADLDPGASKEVQAQTLMGRIEGLLTEAQCLHHTATSIIAHLQGNPEAAAAVALTLAELSTLLAKMSPGFLATIKAGSPAIFALLASPQFLIGTGIAVGVTVVMFGGWKIVQRIKDTKAQQADAAKMAFEMRDLPGDGAAGFAQGAGFGGGSQGFDEAVVLDDDLSTIETWRRGIVPYGEDESVDVELISPEAMRSRIEVHRSAERDRDRDLGDARSVKTERTSRSHRSHKSSRSHGSRASRDTEVPERRSSRGATAETEVDSHRSHRSSRSRKPEMKAIEDGSRSHGAGEEMDVVFRPKKNNMLKQLFKKKQKEDDRVTVA